MPISVEAGPAVQQYIVGQRDNDGRKKLSLACEQHLDPE
jgi:hypothetical protein